MPTPQLNDLGQLVEADRVHKSVYASEEVYEKELEHIFH